MTDALRTALRLIDKHSVATIRTNSKDREDWAEDMAYVGKVAREALAASAAPAVPPGWQPIETAPDGVMLLFADMQASEARHWAFCGWRHSGLRGNAVQMPDNTARTATHWKPLGPAPDAAAPTAQQEPARAEGE